MKIMAILLLGLLTGLCFLFNLAIPFIFLALIFYFWLAFEYPEIALFISFLVIVNCFSLISEDFLRLPGVFKIKDILFIATFLPLMVGLLSKRIKLRPIALSKPIWLIVFFTCIEILFSVLIEGQGINYTLRMGRRYFYYLLFFPMVYLIDNEKKFRRFLYLLIIAALFFALLKTFQYFIGPSRIIFKYADSVSIQTLSGKEVLRSYVSGAEIATLVLFVFFYSILFFRKKKIINLTILSFIFLGGIYLDFSRAKLFGIISGVAFTTLSLSKLNARLKILVLSIVFIALLFCFSEGVRALSGESISNPIWFAFKHLASGFKDLFNRTGTFGFRLEDSAQRIALIKENFFLGIGFIHPESKIININTITSGIITADSGLITLLLDFGLTGIIWLSVLSMYFFKVAKKAYYSSRNSFAKVLALATFSFYFSKLFSFLTLTDFVNYEGIVVIAIVLFVITFVKENLSNGAFNSNSQLQY